MRKFKGKKVAVLGVSVEGLDTVKFFTNEGARVLCCDRRTKKVLGSMYTELQKYPVAFQLGERYLQGLENQDIVVRTPGMSPRLPQLVSLRKSAVEITTLTNLFFELCRAPIIGVTGTKGKGTTCTLIARMLEKGGESVYLGGNVGVPLLSKVRQILPSDWVVLELSSFQLEDLRKSPFVAVILRITQDHLVNFDKLATNYHLSKETYVEAKQSIVRYQKKGDFIVVNSDDPVARAFANLTPAYRLTFSRHNTQADAYVQNHTVYLRTNNAVVTLCSKDTVSLRGDHNLENIAASALAAHTAGVSVEAIQNAAQTFEGLEHRLEFVICVNGVSYFNDSFSTIPETTIAAIESFTEPLVLVLGGSEKGSDFTQMGKEIARSSVQTVIVIGDMTKRITKALGDAMYRGSVITGCRTMKRIIATAARVAPPGGVVLLSPACASFDMFQNYKDRGKQFKDEVNILTHAI